MGVDAPTSTTTADRTDGPRHAARAREDAENIRQCREFRRLQPEARGRLSSAIRPQYSPAQPCHRRFSEIGYLAGVDATDWSWAPLFADLDNDGYKDLFITNASITGRRPRLPRVCGNPVVQASLRDGMAGLRRRSSEDAQIPIANYAYRTTEPDVTNQARAWGLEQPGFSNGAAYVDLNTRALDLVVNRIDAPLDL